MLVMVLHLEKYVAFAILNKLGVFWNLRPSNQKSFSLVVKFTLYKPNGRNIGPILHTLSSFLDTPFNTVIAETKLHANLSILLEIHHYSSLTRCWGCLVHCPFYISPTWHSNFIYFVSHAKWWNCWSWHHEVHTWKWLHWNLVNAKSMPTHLLIIYITHNNLHSVLVLEVISMTFYRSSTFVSFTWSPFNFGGSWWTFPYFRSE